MDLRRYALGCAFNLKEMFMNLKLDKLNISCSECYNVIGDAHRDKLAIKVFKSCYNLVINDIIENNVTFWLPTNPKTSCLKMKRTVGDDFRRLRKAGKWKGLDFVLSNFSGFDIGFFMYGNRTPRVKNVYVDVKRRDRIVEKTNERMNYGDSINDKYVKDYYKTVHSLYPYLTISDVKRILNFGWKSLYLHNSYGGDTLIKDNENWSYIGYLKKSALKHFHYYIRKLCVKKRVLWRRKSARWDGYYYFALAPATYNNYINLQKKRGRPRKYYKLGTTMLYALLTECELTECEKPYIFRIPYVGFVNFKFFLKELVVDKAELVKVREPLKFNDLIEYAKIIGD